MITIWCLKDGYYAVGEEGAKKAFLPSWEHVEFLIFQQVTPNSDREFMVRELDYTLQELFNEGN